MELAPYPHLGLEEEDAVDEDHNQESCKWDRLWDAVHAAESSNRISTDMQYQACQAYRICAAMGSDQ